MTNKPSNHAWMRQTDEELIRNWKKFTMGVDMIIRYTFLFPGNPTLAEKWKFYWKD